MNLDKVKRSLIDELQDRHNCHTIILYGSLARGDATESSDVDAIGIKSNGKNYRVGKPWEGSLLDAWIYSETNLPPIEQLLHIKDGIVLREKELVGSTLLRQIRELAFTLPKPIPQWEIQMRIAWINKMVSRASAADIEGNYRLHWLLFDLLETWFSFSDRRFFGPKEGFKLLKNDEPKLFDILTKALRPNAAFSTIKELCDKIIEKGEQKIIANRPARLEDAEQIADVHVKAWKETYPGIVPQDYLDKLVSKERALLWQKSLTTPDPCSHTLVAASKDNQILGFVNGGPNRASAERFDGEIYAIYLLKEYQGQGLGRNLFLDSFNKLKTDGFKNAILWVLKENSTRKFYEEMGGEIVGEKMITIGGKQLNELAYGWKL